MKLKAETSFAVIKEPLDNHAVIKRDELKVEIKNRVNVGHAIIPSKRKKNVQIKKW